jgi:hypothetical protein
VTGRPVVVTIPPYLRHPLRAGTADVLIAAPDHRSASEVCSDLLRRYPRAILVLAPDQTGGALVMTRIGEPVRVRLPEMVRSDDTIRILAVLLFDLIAGDAGDGHPPEAGPKIVGAA